MNINQITILATDVRACIDFYRALGLRMIVDSAPRYVRFECPDGDSTLSIHQVDSDDEPAGGVVIYFECEDLDEQVARLRASGVEFEHGPEEMRWLWREARLRDPAGNRICLYRAGENRRHPPWRVGE
jgi:catechol 2,3-dioxygenase-like lactoylglutathione lyase family enzyme